LWPSLLAAAVISATAATAVATTSPTKPSYPSKSYSTLKVTKTAVAKYERTYDWTITKQATPQSPVTTPNSTATFSYTVTVTKGTPVDGNYTVTGVITVKNPGKKPVTGVTVTDAIKNGPTCVVSDGTNLTVPAYGTITVPYTCSLDSKTDGTNKATVTWYGGKAYAYAPFAFGEPTTVVNDAVDVTDRFNNGATTILGSGITESKVFTYDQTVTVPATGCLPYPNVAKVTSPNITREASAQVEVCRTQPTTPTTPSPPVIIGTPSTPSASLAVSKRGPRIARAGTVVTYAITVRNTSTNAATSVAVSDLLPVGYSVAQRPKGTKFLKGKLVWNLGTLPAGASKTVTVKTRLDRSAAGTRCNVGVASAGNAPTVRTRTCTRVLAVLGAARTPIVTG
jgi:uncharacterized repeat protein (TIGR01451 family)